MTRPQPVPVLLYRRCCACACGFLQIFFSLLGVLMARHSKALLPTWQDALEAAGQRGSNVLQQQLAAVAASGTATDARFKAYVGLLLGLINVSVQVRREDCEGGVWVCPPERLEAVGAGLWLSLLCAAAPGAWLWHSWRAVCCGSA